MVGLFSFKGASATVPGINQRIDTSVTGSNPDNTGGFTSISQDCRYVAFESMATNLVSGYTLTGTFKRTYVRDRVGNTTVLVSQSTSGTPADAYSQGSRISADGRWVVFYSPASNLTSQSNNSGTPHVYIRDLKNNTTQIVDTDSSGNLPNYAAANPSVSRDGKFVVFYSGAHTLVSPNLSTPGRSNIFIKNMSTGAVTLVSRGSGGASTNNNSYEPYMSCEGRYVVFWSTATNLDTTNTANSGYMNAYLYDALAGGTLRNLTPTADAAVKPLFISCNGGYVGVGSTAGNLTASTITTTYGQLYLYNLNDDSFELVSQSSGGAVGNGFSNSASSVSDDGRYVVFSSSATNLVASDTNAVNDVFLRDRQSGFTELVSKASGGTQGNGGSSSPAISPNGQYVSYSSDATNLVTGSTGKVYVSQTGAVNPY